MRISTLASHLLQNSAIRTLQYQLQLGQGELSTGRKADLYAALRGDATLDIGLRSALKELSEYKMNAGVVGLRIDAVQQALASIKDVVTEARDAVMAATGPVSRNLLAGMAMSAIGQINALLNTQIGGRSLFSGVNTDTRAMQPAATVNAATGYSPLQAVQQILANLGPMTDAATALSLANGPDGVSDLFADSHSDPSLRFSATFYLGATSGVVTARLDLGLEIDYGVRGDDPAVKSILEGLHMLAAVPHGSVPEDAFVAWQNEALDRLNNGMQGIIDVAANLGYKQAAVSEASTRHDAALAQINNEIARFEQADPFEVATRLGILQTQLEATLAVPARVSRLTLTNYL